MRTIYETDLEDYVIAESATQAVALANEFHDDPDMVAINAWPTKLDPFPVYYSCGVPGHLQHLATEDDGGYYQVIQPVADWVKDPIGYLCSANW